MSKLEVDTIAPQSGTQITIGESGDTVTIPTGVTLDASNATTTLPANVVTTDGTQTLTNKSIDASQLTGTITPSDGTVTNAKVNASAAIDYSKLNLTGNIALADLSATGTKDATTFLRGDNTFAEVPAGGITEADQWRLTASFTGSGDLTSNLERIDTNSPGLIGTGMSESSGIFTFPSTGVYLITAVFASYLNGSNRAHNGGIHVTTNNSSYTGAASNYTNQFNFGNTVYANSKTEFLFDVTSTSTHKVKFSISTDNASSTTYGGTTENGTCFSFIRLGDT
jgi:hypothetical protein